MDFKSTSLRLHQSANGHGNCYDNKAQKWELLLAEVVVETQHENRPDKHTVLFKQSKIRPSKNRSFKRLSTVTGLQRSCIISILQNFQNSALQGRCILKGGWTRGFLRVFQPEVFQVVHGLFRNAQYKPCTIPSLHNFLLPQKAGGNFTPVESEKMPSFVQGCTEVKSQKPSKPTQKTNSGKYSPHAWQHHEHPPDPADTPIVRSLWGL